MQRTSTGRTASSHNSIYSLQTLSRPSSTIEHPVPPLPRQPEETHHPRDQFLPQAVDRYDRIWGDMAARMGDLDTLASPPSTGMRLVSDTHAKCVEHLRENQIRLAENWAG